METNSEDFDDGSFIDDDEYEYEDNSSIDELDSKAYIDIDVVENESPSELQTVSDISSISIDRTVKKGQLSLYNEKFSLNHIKNVKDKEFYNSMSKIEFVTALCYLTDLLKRGMTPLINIPKIHDNYEVCNEETMAVILLLKNKSNLFSKKDNSIDDKKNTLLLNISNYPIQDVIIIFKYYYKYMAEIDYVFKEDILKELFPNIIQNINNNDVTKEEIDDCLKE